MTALRRRSCLLVPTLLCFLLLLLSIDQCFSFCPVLSWNGNVFIKSKNCLATTTCCAAAAKDPRNNEQENKEEQQQERKDYCVSDNRRNFLRSSSIAVASWIAASASSPFVANAAAKSPTDAPPVNDNKVVLQVPSNNYPQKYAGTSTSAVSSSSTESGICLDPEEKRIDVFERTAPSVVFIDTFTEQRDAFSTNVMEVPLGAGSGFVWDDRGHIVTNYHVVRNAKAAQVAILTRAMPEPEVSVSAATKKKTTTTAFNMVSNSNSENSAVLPYTSMRPTTVDYKRSVYKARVVGVDPGKDIAVLKVDAPVYDLFPIELGTSKGLRVGSSALAIGNPFGLDHTLTSGVISGIGREVKSPTGRPISNVIQTDAAINPGNSGGPLLDSTGKLIGMNTAIYSPSGGSAGIGFAIPIDSVKFIVETLIRDGRVVRPVLGISYLESKQARALGINKGVLVLEVPTSSPAFKAGLKGTRRTESGLVEIGDIIIKVGDTTINTEANLFEALEDYKPGDRVKIVVNRADFASPNGAEPKLKEVTLTIQLKASSDVPPQTQQFQYQEPSRGHPTQ